MGTAAGVDPDETEAQAFVLGAGRTAQKRPAATPAPTRTERREDRSSRVAIAQMWTRARFQPLDLARRRATFRPGPRVSPQDLARPKRVLSVRGSSGSPSKRYQFASFRASRSAYP